MNKNDTDKYYTKFLVSDVKNKKNYKNMYYTNYLKNQKMMI